MRGYTMNKSSEQLTRLHLISIFYFIVVAIKETLSNFWLFPIIVFGLDEILSNKISIFTIGLVIAVLTLLIILIIGIVRWYLFGYVIHEDSIFLQTGIVNKKQTWISADRIHSINTSIRLYDRIFSTHTLLIELASAEDSSIVFSCLSNEEERRIREVLHRNNEKNVEKIEETIKLSKKDILLHACLSPNLGALYGLIIIVFFKYLETANQDEINTVFAYFTNLFSFMWIFITLGIIFILSVIVSFLFIYEKNYKFTLIKNNGELEITHGLIVKKQRTLVIERIQSIILVEKPLQRLFGYVTVQAVIIQRGKEENSEKTITLLPSIKKKNVDTFLNTFVVYERVAELQSLTKKANFYYKVLPLLIGIIIAIPVWFFMPFSLHYIAPIIPIILFIYGFCEYNNIGWEQSEQFFTLQYGSFTRKTAIIKIARIQWTSVNQTIFQKNNYLANLKVAVASGQDDIMFNVKQLPFEEANCMRDRVSK